MMITDRTRNDVDNAIAIREKIKNGESITESEILTFERGFLTINTLNRVESKQAEIAQILSENGYITDITTKTWDYTGVFDLIEHNRLIDNLEKLKKSFFVFKSTPDVPLYMYGYQEMNDIEKVLVDIETLVNNMTSSYVYLSSDIYSGGI